MMLTSRADYDKELRLIDEVVGAAIKVSTVTGGLWTSNRYITATQLYNRLAVSAVTFLRALPNNRFLAGLQDWWDWPSAATLSRSMLELYLTFFYIGIDETDDEDVDFRLKLFDYHNNYEKWRLYRDFGISADRLTDFTSKLPGAKAELSDHPMFVRLTADQKNRVKSSKFGLYMTRSEIQKRLPFKATEIGVSYRFFSHQVHSSALASLSQGGERGRGFENETERAYLIWAIRLWRKYTSAAIIGLESFVADHFESPKDAELNAAVIVARTNLDQILTEGGI